LTRPVIGDFLVRNCAWQIVIKLLLTPPTMWPFHPKLIIFFKLSKFSKKKKRISLSK